MKKKFKDALRYEKPSANVIDKRGEKPVNVTTIYKTPAVNSASEGKRDRENDPTSPMKRVRDAVMKQENFFSGKRLKRL